MSEKWPGGFIQPVPPTPTGPLASGSATGVWTVDQMSYWLKQGLWPIAGNFLYIEDVFSTWLYTGNDSTQTITNGIDLSGKGGLIWLKKRNNTSIHGLWDTARGGTKRLNTSAADAESTLGDSFTFNSNGFTIPAGGSSYLNESSANTYASWTFREQPKFFDIVTYSGDSVDNRQISHNLGSTPGCVIVRRLSGDNWFVYHRSLATNYGLRLDTTSGESSNTSTIKSVSSTTFTVGTDGMVNTTGSNYVAYLFAHDAGGFGASGSDNVISCGSWTNNGSGNASVTLGYEPQWILWKRSDSTSDWYIFDTMRGWTGDPNNSSAGLRPNLSNAENSLTGYAINSTGFSVAGVASASYIYIAIRRGPMKTPTTGTSVFAPLYNTQSAGTQNTTNFAVDTMIIRSPGGGENNHMVSRLQGVSTDTTDSGQYMYTQSTAAEASGGITRYWSNIGFQTTSGYGGYATIYLPFQRAPGFHDVVCYTGTGVARTVTHNLTVVPELMIVKCRGTPTSSGDWDVYSAASGPTKVQFLNTTDEAVTQSTHWNNTAPTASVFTVGTNARVNESGLNYVAYLFATCPGVSKVGSYTGTGALQTVNCGFTSGARFVLIKRTDSTGDWYLYNSARGISSGNDPYILLNSTAAEVTGTNYVDTTSVGFQVTAAAPAALNANGGTFLFFAIA